MATKKITDLTELTTAANDDEMHIVDVSDTTMGSTGTNKRITITNLATAVASAGSVSSVTGGTGLTASPTTGAVVVDLDNTAVTAGSYTIADITVDAQGRITAAANGTALQDVQDDTTPQLGGALDTNRNNILFGVTGTPDHSSNGHIIKFGSGSTTRGELCYLNGSGGWTAADADAANASSGMLAIALGTDPDVDGMLIQGFYTLDYDPGTIGNILYVSTTAGDITSTAPSATGDIVRVVGYCLDSTNGQIYFNPSSDYIEIA